MPPFRSSQSHANIAICTVRNHATKTHPTQIHFQRTVRGRSDTHDMENWDSPTPSFHIQVSFPCEPRARLLFHKILSANIIPCTFADVLKSVHMRSVPPARPRISTTRIQRAQRSTAIWRARFPCSLLRRDHALTRTPVRFLGATPPVSHKSIHPSAMSGPLSSTQLCSSFSFLTKSATVR